MKTRLVMWLRPPSGCDVRRLIAWLTLAVALPRLPLFDPSVSMTFYPLGILPQEVFGWLFLVMGLGLLATGTQRRLQMSGRLFAFATLVAWSILAAATTSTTSRLIDAVIMYVLLGQILAGNDDPC